MIVGEILRFLPSESTRNTRNFGKKKMEQYVTKQLCDTFGIFSSKVYFQNKGVRNR